ncbi:squalene/phytoene synthase family protein [Novosphingobium sp. TH158]|uniref:squalene/phytoene synthase family protein n=1 Tax=Novosphingobium sp. TH158 TaxID=2067455 RepID=UPI000C798477|nr:squalene/phytoene synthase family protein [Novosphingobium sp. TH158]PLK27750.1 hypothetical protein C0V78_02260 [Novosphingobium sp. TH158]
MDPVLLDSLPPLSRLALSYAPAAARADWLTLLALDARLAGVVRQAREPVLAQIRLAWWRERLEQDPADRPRGEPLLARLAEWPDGGRGLEPLVDGWEALLEEPPLSQSAVERFAAGRAGAVVALASRLGADVGGLDETSRRWALADLACHLGAHEERAVVQAMLRAVPATVAGDRALRPLLVLERVTCRAAIKSSADALTSPMALLVAMRAGLLGR